jgi:MoaA/NifB/PqqE/SkfB family radical SAM enzyme
MDGPWRITFETNPDLCNLHCRMCEVHSPYNREKLNRCVLPFPVIERVVSSAAPHGLREIIPSTMGEPLLYQDFDDILALVKSYSLKVNLTTNGTFPLRGAESWGNAILPIASDTKISMNGATARTAEGIMHGLNFERQVSNLAEYIGVRDEVRRSGANDPTVTVQATFMRSNLDELPDMLRMAIDMGVDRFKGHHVWVTHPEIMRESLKMDVKSIREWNACAELMRRIADDKRLPSGKKIVLANVYPLREDDGQNDAGAMTCPFLGKEAWVSNNGRFDVCCAPDVKRRTLGEYGNVVESDIMDIWHGEAYRNLVGVYGDHEVCGQCNMKVPSQREAQWWISAR